MSHYRAAVIGAGRPIHPTGVGEGFAIAYQHAAGYQATEQVEIVAAADIDRGNLEAFATHFAVPAIYHDYHEMLERERPDLVSICTWPSMHPEMVVDTAAAGVRGILCEKPMALSLGEADRMLEACARMGTRLSICHQRRLVPPWTTARTWLQDGYIGRLIRMEAWLEGWDLLSYGTHWLDMFFFFLGDRPARWVFAQVDTVGRQRRYAHPVEDRSLTMVGFDDDVTGLLHIAPEARGIGVRLIGSDGQIEVEEGAQAARLIGGAGGRPMPAEAAANSGRSGFTAAVQDLADAIEAGREPQLGGTRGRNTTEVIMAAYASGIERRLIALPYMDPASPLTRLFEEPGGVSHT